MEGVVDTMPVGTLANHELWFNDDLFGIALSTVETMQHALRGYPSHVDQWLTDSDKPRIVEAGPADVAETDDGMSPGNQGTQARFNQLIRSAQLDLTACSI
jgi:hypothetical protein